VADICLAIAKKPVKPLMIRSLTLLRIVLCLGLPSLLNSRQVLIVAGNFSFYGALANLAQYDFATGSWLHKYEPGLYLYGASNGVVLDMVTNTSSTERGGDTAYLVGAFDSDAQTSQVAYCSVGGWDGYGFGKVGEGLCPRGVDSSSSSSIRSVTLGNPHEGNIFVGGNFHARVWNGEAKSFVDVYDLAVYSGANGWLPLPLVGNSQLMCKSSANCNPGVYSLAWDAAAHTLFIGGIFDSLDTTSLTPSLCQWTEEGGIQSFPGGGLSNSPINGVYTQVTALAFESTSQSLFVAGSFYSVSGTSCQNLAVWSRRSGAWSCLYQDTVNFGVITAMHLDSASMHLYIAGWASATSTWKGNDWGCPYAAARADIKSMASAMSVAPHRRRYLGGKGSPEGPEGAGLGAIRNSDNFVKGQRSLANSTFMHTAVHWEWLGGFPGGNGPILRFLPLPGTDGVFIAGAFNNYHAVVLWFSGNSSTRSLMNASVLSGDVAALTLMNIGHAGAGDADRKHRDTVRPTGFPDSVHALSAGIAAAVVFVLVVAIAFTLGFRTKIEYESIVNEEEANSDEDFAVDMDMTSISLNALTGGMRSQIDIELCFENAMRSRHIRFRDSLMSIKSDDIMLARIIGEGSYGRVWAGHWRNEPVAVKEFVFAQTALLGGSMQTAELIEEIIGEAGIMSLLKHPKILQLYGVSLTTQTIWIVSELCSSGSLRMLLNDQSIPLPLLTRLSICLDISEGLYYLHSRRPPILHRDLKVRHCAEFCAEFMINNSINNALTSIHLFCVYFCAVS
jgi:hypothetical protein